MWDRLENPKKQARKMDVLHAPLRGERPEKDEEMLRFDTEVTYSTQIGRRQPILAPPGKAGEHDPTVEVAPNLGFGDMHVA